MDEMMMLLVPEDIAAEVLLRHGQQNHIAYMAFPGTHIMGLFGTKGTEHGRGRYGDSECYTDLYRFQ